MGISIAQATLQSLVDEHTCVSYKEALGEIRAYIAEVQKPSHNIGSLQSIKLAFIGGYVSRSKVDAVPHDVAFKEWLDRQQTSA